MRCNPWRWLWGLIPVAMLSWVTYHWERQGIEADLGQRAAQVLGQKGLDWAEVTFEGRDAVLRGRAPEEDQPKRALEIVRDLRGVRVVHQRADLMPKPDVFSWLATHDKGKLVLSGHVPSEAARKSILTVAAANFPKSRIEDAMQPARGAPPIKAWTDGTSFALRQLAQLRKGTADLAGVSLRIAGEASDAAAYRSVKAALGKLPPGVKLGGENIQPAVVSPYTWSAKWAGEKVILSGYVPSEKAREEIFARAKGKFGKSTVVDRMEVASGEPDGWSKAVLLALDQLSLLEEGSSETRAAQLTVSGMAPDQSTADAVRKVLRTGLPGTFKFTETIKFRPPVERPVDYQAQWREAEARWAAQEANRKPQAEAQDDGSEPWWKSAQSRLAEAPRAPAPQAGDAADRKSQDEERRLAALAEEEAARKKAAEDAARRKAAEEESRRRLWLDLEMRWSANNEEYERRRREEEERRQAELVIQEQRRVEANKCQSMMRETAKKGRIMFRTDSAELDAKSAPTLLELVKISAACPTARVEITGHTDGDGDAGYNKSLSLRRAQAIAAFLTKAGMDAGRLSAIGRGEENHVAPNDTAANKAKNRRIEFTVQAN